MVTIHDIKSAAERIKPYINQTPVLTSHTLNEIVQAELFFKCENFQKAGAFKFRGACNAVFSLSDEDIKNGVATHSSGNHGAAVALAAKKRGLKAYIVMPNNSADVKKRAVLNYGAEVILCEPTLESRKKTLNAVVEKTKAIFIHPYDNEKIISGQGTVALELLEKIPELDVIISPVGGGGLLSGTVICVKAISPKIQVVAAEPLNANDAYLSLKEKKFIPCVNPATICDGLRTSLGEMTFPIILNNIELIFTATESGILQATQYLWERMKIVIEPSSAVTLAIILENKEFFKNKKIGLILSGGNVDIKKIANLL